MKNILLISFLYFTSCTHIKPIYTTDGEKVQEQVFQQQAQKTRITSHAKHVQSHVNIEQTNAEANIYQEEDINYQPVTPPNYTPGNPETLTVEMENIETVENKQPEMTQTQDHEVLSSEAASIYENLEIANQHLDEETPQRNTNAKVLEDDEDFNASAKPQEILEVTQPSPQVIVTQDQASTTSYVESEFLSYVNEERKNKWRDYFTGSSKERFERFLANGSKYQDFVMRTFIEEGLPKELYYVGIAESGYQMKARSSASAVGPWQFIKGAGKEYGLRINSYVDERRNIYKATKAAALYFKDLYNIFGSWELALSAYNAGPYRIIALIRKYNTRDYWELIKTKTFPRETAEYVPKIAAIMELASNPEANGFQVNYFSDQTNKSSLIPVRYSLSLDTIAKKLSLSTKELKDLNPELLKSYTPFRKKTAYMIRVPNRTLEMQSSISSLEHYKGSNPYRRSYQVAKKTKSGIHKVRKGETLSSIAMRYKTSSMKLMKINKFKNPVIFIGQKLKVPSSSSKSKTHLVKNGENLTLIAKKFKTTPKAIMKKNSLENGKIFPGQKLIVR